MNIRKIKEHNPQSFLDDLKRQIVAAALGGSILALFTPEGMLPPEINMLVTAGVMLIIGAACVYLIKETKGERA